MERYWHEVLFTGPADVEPLIDAAETVGFKLEVAGTDSDANFVGTPVLLDQANQRIAELERELEALRG